MYCTANCQNSSVPSTQRYTVSRRQKLWRLAASGKRRITAEDMHSAGRPAVNIQHSNSLTRSLVIQLNGESYAKNLNPIK
jgi:hypothetical protein